MGEDKFLQKIKAKADQNKHNRADIRFKKTIALLKGKGLLQTNQPIAAGTGMKLDIQDAIWAGRNVEPRILEVLPAAILHYQSNFLGLKNIPQELAAVCKAIRNNEDQGPDFDGIAYDKMKNWANMQLPDKRTKPVGEQRRKRTYKLHPSTLNKLHDLVTKGKFKDQTSAIEAAIERLSLFMDRKP